MMDPVYVVIRQETGYEYREDDDWRKEETYEYIEGVFRNRERAVEKVKAAFEMQKRIFMTMGTAYVSQEHDRENMRIYTEAGDTDIFIETYYIED